MSKSDSPSFIRLYALGSYHSVRSLAYNFVGLLRHIRYWRLWAGHMILAVVFAGGRAYRVSAEVDAAFDDETISELTYGETLIPAAVEILDALDVKPGDTLFELGAGRGIFALTAATICDLQVEAVDRLRPFIDVGRWLCELLGIESIRWRCEDLVEVDLSAADHVYVSGTCLKESRLDQLTDNMSQLRSGARVASITCYLDSPQLRDVARLQLPFSWGMSSVYIQERV